MSLSHWMIEGYLADFLFNNNKRLASKDVKAIMSFCAGLGTSEWLGIPNIAMRAQGWRFTTRTVDIINPHSKTFQIRTMEKTCG